MLATVLKSTRATKATLAIIETYAQVRSMVRDMEAIQTEKAGSPEQANMLTRAGHKLAGAHRRQSLNRVAEDDDRAESRAA